MISVQSTRQFEKSRLPSIKMHIFRIEKWSEDTNCSNVMIHENEKDHPLSYVVPIFGKEIDFNLTKY